MDAKKAIECVVVGSIETNCWLYPISHPIEEGTGEGAFCVIIDPGDEASLIISRLEKIKWIPRYIILTHGHFDHLAALPGLLYAFKKGIFAGHTPPKVCVHRQDAHYLGKDALAIHRKSYAAAGGNASYINSLLKPLKEADILFEEGDIIGPFRILHIPGHTPGSSGLYDEKAGTLFSGDTLFRGDYGRTDLPGGNEELIQKSLKRLFSLPKETEVYPGHGPATTIEEEITTA